MFYYGRIKNIKVGYILVTLKAKLKMNKKNIVVIILIIVLIALVGYLYSGVTKCKDTATDLGAKLQECGAGLETCTTQATQCQEALTNLQQMCAPYLPAE